MRKRIMGTVLATGLVVMTLSGCVVESLLAVGAAAGASAMYLGLTGAREVIGAPMQEVYEAAGLTLEELGDGVVEDIPGTTNAKLSTRFSDATRVTVKMKMVSTSATKLRVWVGVFGNRARAEQVVRAIIKRLEAAEVTKAVEAVEAVEAQPSPAPL